MKLKTIKNFIDCKENIIHIEISRYLLNQESSKMTDDVSNRLWIESDIMLSKEINKLASMLSDDVSDYETISYIIELVANEALIKDIICTDNDIIPVDEIVAYIKQDIEEKLPN